MNTPVGIIAGDGQLPLLVARSFERQGRGVVVCTVAGDPPDELDEIARARRRIDLTDLESLPAFFEGHDVRDVIMVGAVDRTRLYEDERVARADPAAGGWLGDLPDKRDINLIEAGADFLREHGFRILGLDEVLGDRLTPQGHLAGPALTDPQKRTLEVLRSVAGALVQHDVGQAVAGKRQSVVAVEAAEGTDAMIRRAGSLAGPGCVVLKRARPRQDFRYDVPVVGERTVRNLKEVEGSVLAVEAGRTLWVQREACRRLADEGDITLLGRRMDGTPEDAVR